MRGLLRISQLRLRLTSGSGKSGGDKFISAIISLAQAGIAVGVGYVLASLLTSPYSDSIVAIVSSLSFLSLTLLSPLYGLVLAVITRPLSIHFAVLELGQGIPNSTIDRLIIGFVLVLFFLQTMTGRRRLYFSWLYLVAFAFVGIYSFSFHNYNWSTSRAIQFLLDTWLLPIVICFFISNLIDDDRKLNIVLNLLLIVGVYSVLYMLYEQTTGNILFAVNNHTKNFYGDSTLRITRGLYGTTTTFGNVFNLLLPFSLFYFLRARTSTAKVWYLLVAGLIIVGIFFTYKRSVWLGMLLSFLIIQWYYPKFRKLFFAIMFIAVIGMATSWDRISQTEVVTTRITGTDDWEDANGRTERWAAGIETWQRNPLMGSGFRSYARGEFREVENLYIHLLASGGLVTFVPFMIMLFMLLGYSIKIYRHVPENRKLFVDRNLIVVWWGAFASYFFMAYFGSGVEGDPISNYSLFLISGAIVGTQVPRLEQTKSRLIV